MRRLPHTHERGTNQFVDPEYAPSVEVFDNLTHEEIHRKVQLLDPSALAAGKQAWHGSAGGLAEAVAQAHTEIRAAIADGWRGGAAETAAATVRDFEHTGQRLADVMAAVAQRLGQAGDAAEALKAAVPQPADERADLSGALLNPATATANTAVHKAAEGARQDVVQAMDSIYATAFLSSGTGVPAFPDGIGIDGQSGAPASGGHGVSGTVAAQPISHIAATTSEVASGSDAPERTTAAAARPATVAESTATETPATRAAAVSSATASTGAVTPAATQIASAAATLRAVSTKTAGKQQLSSATPGTATASTNVQPIPPIPTRPTQSEDDKRKREERREDSGPTGDAVTGVGAGAIGGLVGGAFAAAEAPRSGPSVAAGAARAARAEEDDEDEDYHFVDDDLTFLEPGEDGTDLIGSMDPTTPPVLGEWTELE
ncbi:hypothetical protein D5S18_01780 [Nocardia panacis]|uniref:PPE domain-containing protein n=1 Tax=Nocardia panacis TaxID=2340916 RepID=A0A3A4KX36_9NOCA|nr:hypothetical protein [Nocardia panacis]RJO80001.1 hypothetical protein D5S18_01780 [Nocardia panacis]